MKMLLYVLKAKNKPIYKIGITSNIGARLQVIKNSSPIDITIVEVYKEINQPIYVEKTIHNHFSNNRLHGEWFKLSKPQVKSIKDLIIKFDLSSEKHSKENNSHNSINKSIDKYNIKFEHMINRYFNLLGSGKYHGRMRPQFAKEIGITDGSFARVLSIHKNRPDLIKKMDDGLLSINQAYQLVKWDGGN